MLFQDLLVRRKVQISISLTSTLILLAPHHPKLARIPYILLRATPFHRETPGQIHLTHLAKSGAKRDFRILTYVASLFAQFMKIAMG